MSQRVVSSGTALLVVDVQERLAAAMNPSRFERVLNRTRAAILGAQALGWPIVVTEQYPKGLGPTVAPVRELLGGVAPIEKLEFSAFIPPVIEALGERVQVLVVGMETHVCVFQTVRAMRSAGLSPLLAADAVLSRVETDGEVGLELSRGAGAIITTVETALFDALGKAGTPQFKAVSAAVK